MIDIHPPHKSDHTWTDFFIHIATICVGLIIAIGLEQTVEAVHHLHQRRELEENLRSELRADLRRDAVDFRVLADIRAYTLQLSSAVSARRAGKPSPPAPPASTDNRRNEVPLAPSIAIWDTAKLDATMMLLPATEIELYHAIVLQHISSSTHSTTSSTRPWPSKASKSASSIRPERSTLGIPLRLRHVRGARKRRAVSSLSWVQS